MSTEEETKAVKAETKDEVMKEDEKKEDTKKEEETKVAEAETKKEVKDEDEKKEEDTADNEVVKSVAERLKFFFSDANVRQDMFMRKFLMPYRNKDDDGTNDGDKKEEDKDKDKEEEDRSVPIETLLRFNTIKRYTTEPKVVVKAVKEHLSEKLTLKDDDTAIARVKPFTKELIHENIPLSLYVSNLPVKEQERGNRKQTVYDVNMQDIRELFEVYGEVAIVKMRFKSSAYSNDEHHTDDIKMADDPPKESGSPKRAPRRRFPLGCCMVEFENLEDHGKAVEDVLTKKEGEDVEPKRKLQLGENTLQVMLLKDYVESVAKRRKKRDRDGEGNDDDNKDKDKEDEEIAKFTVDWKPGCVVSMKGLPESCDREAILEAVSKVCDIDTDKMKENKIHADYSRGQKDGAIQFCEAELATKMMEKLKSGDAKISDATVEEVSVLEGDDEKKYWDDYIELRKKYMRERKHHKHNKHNNNSKRRKGGHHKKYETLQS